MGIIERILSRFGYIRGKSWAKLWAMAQEWKLFGKSVVKPYEQISNVYKAVKAIADNVPQAELVFKDYKTEEEVYPDELIALFERPNPLMSYADFLQAISVFYALYGETFIVKVQSVGQVIGTKKLPAELWTFNPTKFTELKNTQGELTGWRYGAQVFSKDEVIHVKDPNPYNEFRGLAPTKPLKEILDIDWLSLVYNKAFFDNDATPGFVLSTDKTLTKQQIERLQNWWNKRHQGASKAFKLAVLEAGLKPEKISLSHKDMEFIEQKRFTREEILGIWRAPKALFNITEDLNYATFMGQMKIFWLYTICPILRKFEDAFNAFLVRPYNPKIYCQFDYSNVPAFQQDFADKVKVGKMLFEMGFTANEINEKLELGFEPKPWRDSWWIPFNLLPAGTATPQQGGNGNGKSKKQFADGYWEKIFLKAHTPIEERMTRVIKRYFFEQRKRALANLGGKAVKVVTAGGLLDWDDEDEELIRMIRQYLWGAIEAGVNLGKDNIGINVNEDILRNRMRAYLTISCRKITRVNDTIRRQLQAEIDEAIQQGETVNQIADRVRRVYNMASTRAKVIARTETTGAMNGGTVIYYKEAGVRKKKWVTAGDEAVRDSHAAINGEEVLISERFSNGLDYPGGDGPPEEVINCRCTIQPVIEEV